LAKKITKKVVKRKIKTPAAPAKKKAAAAKKKKTAPAVKPSRIKKARRKSLAPTLKRKVVSKPPKEVPAPEPEPTVAPPAAPARAPRRSIIGANGVEVRAQTPQMEAAQSEALGDSTVAAGDAPASESSIQVNAPQIIEAPPAPKSPTRFSDLKLPWGGLPATTPPYLRYMIGKAEKECEQAASWPFPFGKFISTLPADLCGLGFALWILKFEHSEEKIAEICQMSLDAVEGSLNSARAVIEERFLANCPEIYRKWTAQLGGSGKDIESLLAHYQIPKIDQAFQLLVAQLVLKILGAWHPVLDGKLARDRWSLDPKLIH
jgi:hypothetical protein